MKASEWISLSAVILGSGGFFSGIYLWWSGSIRKSFAAERDFGHIKKNQEQLNQALTHLDDKISESTDSLLIKLETRLDRNNEILLDVKSMLMAHLARKD